LTVRDGLLRQVSLWGSVMFYDGLMIAAPVGAAMLVAYLVMGLLGRVVRQIQLFAVGFPVTIALGLFITALSLDLYVRLLDGMFHDMFRNVSDMIKGMT
jgi:flagellar biosynthetic protein FliR